MSLIKVGICVAYDWEYLKISLPMVYSHADRICLSIDRNRMSWSGKGYEIDEKGFVDFVKTLDIRGIVDIYEDDFCLPHLSALENDTRQRQLMATKLGLGGWHIQIDSDEYFIDFESFVMFLRSKKDLLRSQKPINICCFILPMFKRLPNGFLIVKNKIRSLECIQIATNMPSYEHARRNSHYNYKAPFFIIHQTWARSEDEVWAKINGWGHENDFIDKTQYYNFWLTLNEQNYKGYKNFHPIYHKTWESLEYVEGKDIFSAIENIKRERIPSISKVLLYFSNNKLYLSLRQLFGL